MMSSIRTGEKLPPKASLHHTRTEHVLREAIQEHPQRVEAEFVQQAEPEVCLCTKVVLEVAQSAVIHGLQYAVKQLAAVEIR